MRFLALVAIPLALSIGGCGGEEQVDPNDEAVDLQDPEAKADGMTQPLGTYVNSATVVGQFSLLTINTNKTFYRETVVACIKAPCPPVGEEGTHIFTKSGSTKYIQFMQEGSNLDRYAYKLSGKTLSLRKVGATKWFTMTQSNACESASGTCVALVPNACPNGKVGDSNTYSCGSGLGVECCLPVQGNACQLAGGQCVALYPGTCSNGKVGNANTYSCGGALGVQCCLPNACIAAGGTCVALYPGTCPNGKVGNANTYSCGGSLGVQCCLPK